MPRIGFYVVGKYVLVALTKLLITFILLNQTTRKKQCWMKIVSKFVDKQQEIDSIKTLHWLLQSWVNYGFLRFFIFLEQLFSSELSRNCFWSLIFQLNYLQIIFLVYWIIKTLVFIPNPFRKPVPRYVFLRNSLLTDPILVQHFHEIWWLFLKFICD